MENANMITNETFKKCFNAITKSPILSWDEMDWLVETLLPGYSFKRSARGPRATKFLYDESDKMVFNSNLNYKVGLHALELAADTDYKKALIDAYKAKIKINELLKELRNKYDFGIDIEISGDSIDIFIKDSDI
jgi:hypothetical protein